MFDILIKNGLVVDGTGTPPQSLDIGIKEEKITALGDLSTSPSEYFIDAFNLVVTPGFIDIHAHSEFNILLNPLAESKLRQGVTTEVCGNCGVSPSPLLRESKSHREESLASLGLKIDWTYIDEYFARVQQQGIALNLVLLTGQGTIRSAVMGFQNRKPTSSELSQMKKLLRQDMEMGGWGLSLGLIYPPGLYTSTEELIELAKVVKEYNGIITAHIRSEGDHILEALQEVIEIVKKSGVPLQISHLKTSGEKNWEKLETVFKLIESAQAEGIDITADRYPYISSSADLDAILPAWAFEGGNAKELERLNDQNTRKMLKEEILREHPEPGYWERIRIASLPTSSHPEWEGKNIAEIAESVNKHPCDLFFDILLEEKLQVEAIFFGMNESNLREILKKPYVMIGSDSAVRSDYGVLKRGKPHPRAFGTFPRILSKYVKEEKVLTLEQAIYKMCGQAAKRIGLEKRGFLKEGFYADLTILNLEEIKDKATFEDPYQYPQGIKYVIVNGKVAVKDGKPTGKLAGKILRR